MSYPEAMAREIDQQSELLQELWDTEEEWTKPFVE